MSTIKKGTWVEIESVILTPDQRAVNLPAETKKVPYVLHVSGFLMEDAALGDMVQVCTIIGRELSGKLITVEPHYAHSFGNVVPELLTIGTEEVQ